MQLVLNSGLHVVSVHGDGVHASTAPGCCIVAVPDATPVEIGQTWEVDLDAAKASVSAELDATAECLRNTVLTPGSGQMAAYQEKERQARALLADDTPTEAEYPDIYNEIGITADSAGEVAMAVVTASDRWRGYGRGIERVRLAGKKAVTQAADSAGILAARDGIVWA